MPSILVIDSHAELRRYTTAFLTRAGHRAIGVETVTEAAATLAAMRIDIVATDLALGVRVPGESLVRLWREHPSVKIVALSDAAQSSGYLRLAAVLGAAWTFARPFMSEALIALTRPASAPVAERPESPPAPFRRGMTFPQNGSA